MVDEGRGWDALFEGGELGSWGRDGWWLRNETRAEGACLGWRGGGSGFELQ